MFETKWQRDERDKAQKRTHTTRNRRIIGYTFGTSIDTIKTGLIKILTCDKLKNSSSTSPQKPVGRPRANSLERLLDRKEFDDGRTNVRDTQSIFNMKGMDHRAEALTQFDVHGMPDLYNDETESENSIDAEIKK